MKLFITQAALKNYVVKETKNLTDEYININRYLIFNYPVFIVTKKKLKKYSKGLELS